MGGEQRVCVCVCVCACVYEDKVQFWYQSFRLLNLQLSDGQLVQQGPWVLTERQPQQSVVQRERTFQ